MEEIKVLKEILMGITQIAANRGYDKLTLSKEEYEEKNKAKEANNQKDCVGLIACVIMVGIVILICHSCSTQ